MDQSLIFNVPISERARGLCCFDIADFYTEEFLQ